jgi:septum formation protein
MPSAQIVLASASPRRRELLAQVGVAVRVVPAAIDESVLPGETAEQHVLRLSHAKALAVAARTQVQGRWFIGSDTVVVRDEVILGKPADSGEAAAMLRSLAARAHTVVSGYAVHDRGTGRTISAAVTTRVWFKALTEREIAGYLATGEPFDKAGAYAIQGVGAFMVTHIEGSYPNVVGLPLCEVLAALEQLGAPPPFS